MVATFSIRLGLGAKIEIVGLFPPRVRAWRSRSRSCSSVSRRDPQSGTDFRRRAAGPECRFIAGKRRKA